MRRTLASLLLAGVGTVTALSTGPVRAQTLPEAAARAVANHPEVQAAAANQRAAVEATSQARAGFFPALDATLGSGRERSNSPITRAAAGGEVSLNRKEAEITLSQLVFDGGAVSSQVRSQESRSESAAYELANTGQTIALQAAQAYLEVLRLRSVIEIARGNVTAHQRTLEQVTLLADRGAGRRSDAQQAEARLALARSTLTESRRQLEQAEAEFRRVVGLSPLQLQKPAAPIERLPRNEQAALDEVLVGHPALKAAEAELAAAYADREFSRARLAPRISVELGATQNQNLDGTRGTNADRTAMLRLRSNLFRGGADTARIREAEARVDRAVANLARVRNDLEREVRVARESFVTNTEQVEYLQAHANASAGVVEAYRSQFRLGQRTLLDVLNAENELFNARSALVNGEYAVTAGSYRILASIGRLLEALGVALPAEARIDNK